MTDRSRFRIVPIGSLHTGWALKIDGIIRRSSPSLISLGAYVDAVMAGADEADADNIARFLWSRRFTLPLLQLVPAGPAPGGRSGVSLKLPQTPGNHRALGDVPHQTVRPRKPAPRSLSHTAQPHSQGGRRAQTHAT
jgi:hypothetical protein